MTSAAARTITPADNQRPLLTEAELKTEFAAQITKLQEIVDAAKQAVAPVFEDDEDLTAAKEQAPKLRGAWKRLEDLRKERKKPFDDGGDVVHVFFKSLQKLVTDVETAQLIAATAYLKKKDEAEKKKQQAIESQQREASAKLAEQAQQQAAAGDVKGALSTQEASEAAGAVADQAAAMVDAKPAERARTTTSAGTATLVDKYSFEIVNKTLIDAFKLFSYFTDVEINAALARAVTAGVRELAGVRIFRDPKARL